MSSLFSHVWLAPKSNDLFLRLVEQADGQWQVLAPSVSNKQFVRAKRTGGRQQSPPPIDNGIAEDVKQHDIAPYPDLHFNRWEVRFTAHPGINEKHGVEPAALFGNDSTRVLVTSFEPMELKFIMSAIPAGAPVTIVNTAFYHRVFFDEDADEEEDVVDSSQVKDAFWCRTNTCLETRQSYSNAASNKVQIVAPRLPKQFLFHAKLWLIQLKTCLRCVVSSFNASLEQRMKAGDTFWIFDAPRKNMNSGSTFADNLCSFLDAMQPSGDVVWQHLVKEHDFSAANDVQLIWSIPGNQRTGMSQLKRAIDAFRPQSPVQTQIQSWSLGGSNFHWYQWFGRSISGSLNDCQFIPAKGGNRHTGCHHARPHAFWDPDCPVDASPSVPWGWHSKMMSRQRACGQRGCNMNHGWVYVGSHNVSGACWGGRSRDGPYSPRNWELGVVIASIDHEAPSRLTDVPLPFSRPRRLQRWASDREWEDSHDVYEAVALVEVTARRQQRLIRISLCLPNGQVEPHTISWELFDKAGFFGIMQIPAGTILFLEMNPPTMRDSVRWISWMV